MNTFWLCQNTGLLVSQALGDTNISHHYHDYRQKYKVYNLVSTGQLVKFNSSPPGQNGHRFPDDIFRCIFMNEKFCILITISLKFAPQGPINNNPALIYIMAWRRIGNKPLSEPMLT